MYYSAPIIPAEAYTYIYYIVIALIGIYYYSNIAGRSASDLKGRPVKSHILIILLSCIVIFFIGLRPISAVFSDMLGYAATYDNLYVVEDKEPGLWWIAALCKELGFNATVWFLIVCAAYYGFTLLAIKMLSPNNWDYIFITFLIAFSTLAYATNGIRNGLALAFLTIGMAVFIAKRGKTKYLSILCFVYAYMTHKSVVLPLACFFAAYYLINFKRAFYFWLLSIIISLVAGSAVSNIFLGLGFDDRLDGYLMGNDYAGFSHAGFRWDFLLYGFMPILLGYYAVIKKGVQDRKYEVLLTTYTLANAFWVMVIRAPFSDRFAYLSWFLYAIVLAYPLFSVDIWGKRQGRIARNILNIHLSFTLFMNLIYYTIIKSVL